MTHISWSNDYPLYLDDFLIRVSTVFKFSKVCIVFGLVLACQAEGLSSHPTMLKKKNRPCENKNTCIFEFEHNN